MTNFSFHKIKPVSPHLLMKKETTQYSSNFYSSNLSKQKSRLTILISSTGIININYLLIHERHSRQLLSPILHLQLIFPCLCCLDRQAVRHIHLQTPSEAHLTLLWIKYLLQVPVWDTLYTEIHKNIPLLGH